MKYFGTVKSYDEPRVTASSARNGRQDLRFAQGTGSWTRVSLPAGRPAPVV